MIPQRQNFIGPMNAIVLDQHTVRWLFHSRLSRGTVHNTRHIQEVEREFVYKLNLLKRSRFLPLSILLLSHLYFRDRAFFSLPGGRHIPPYYVIRASVL